MTTANNNLLSDELTPERIIREERIAILKAIKCPGRTHNLIKNPELRRAYALELNDLRIQSIRGKFRKELSTDPQWMGIRSGMESAFWSMQKQENRAFLSNGQRVTWHLREPEDNRSQAERKLYEEFIEEVKEVHLKALKIKQEILADHQVGKISDHQKYHYLREMLDQEAVKIKNLQLEYRQ